jgi:xylulokinase
VTAVLGIDLGTSQVKVLLAAPDGTVLREGSAGYEITAPRGGWAESDPEQWWRAVRRAILSIAPAEVAGIAVAGQMHGVVLISERHCVLRPAILWLDRRARDEVANYGDIGADQLLALANGASPGTAGPILLWLKQHEPEIYRSARWQLQPKDWLRLRLTGSVCTDPTDASGTLLYDVAGDGWAVGVAEALGLGTRLLPSVRGSAEVAGTLQPEAARDLGLPPGIPVAVGCADTAASLLAASLPSPDWGLLTLGTGGQWIMPVSSVELDRSGNTNLFRAVDGLYRLAGAQNVGVTLDWVRRTLGASWDQLYATAAGEGAERGPVFAPWLVSERGFSGGGGWTGVTLAHDRDDLLRAALTGVAGLLKDRLADLRAMGCAPGKALLGGGGSRNLAWRDLLAEVLDVPLHPTGASLTVRGAAMLAARAANVALSPRYRSGVTVTSR